MSLFGPPDIPKLLTRRDVHGLSKALAYRKDPLIRLSAARALQHVGNSQATKSLILALEDEDQQVCWEVIIALGKIADPAAIPYLVRREVGGKYGDSQVLTVDGKFKLLPTMETLIIDALVEIGPAAVAPLCASLRDGKVISRKRSAMALGKLGDRRAVEPLLATLGDGDRSVRSTAAEALAKLKDERAIPPLVQGLTRYEDRDIFCKSLVSFGEGAVDPLIFALKNENESIRIGAAVALGEMGCAKAAASLIPLLSGLMTQGPASHALEKIGPEAVGPLMAALKNENMKLGLIAYLLGKIGDPQAIIPLIEILNHEQESIRFETTQALGMIGDGRSAPALINIALADENRGVREAAVKSLVKIGRPAIEPLLSLLQDPARQTRQLACETLTAIGWEPDTSQSQLLFWLANREIYRFKDADLRGIQDMLPVCINWELDWYVSGRVAQLLLSSGMVLAPPVRAWAVAEFESFLGQFADFLKSKLETPQSFPWIDEIAARVLFEDYAALVSRASAFTTTERGGGETTYSYDIDFSLSALRLLCLIDSPVSSNLLHHLSHLSDIDAIEEIYEVEYDLNHPTGMATKYFALSFQEHRDAAAKELARRGSSVYDPAIYRQRDCWRLSDKTGPA